ncbi:MAG: ribulose-phosphate 3-epimerase [Planctomycetia bacterium]|nr:ribulose-phosphate 3-epimerase [Planctomycetia bacterium]
MPENVPYIHLRATSPAVLPSLLMCDFGHLADEIARCEAAGAPGLHLDVMDGHFVPNLSYGLPLVETVRRLTRLPLETHLMIAQPEEYVGRYIDAGADVVTFHVEATADPRSVLAEVRMRGAKAGLAFNPPTPLAAVEPFLDECDLVLVMSVHPGFGGQEFEPVALDKLRQLRAREGMRAALEIDGGINEHTIAAAAEAGAHLFVVGSAIFHTKDYRATIGHLTDLAKTRVTT